MIHGVNLRILGLFPHLSEEDIHLFGGPAQHAREECHEKGLESFDVLQVIPRPGFFLLARKGSVSNGHKSGDS